jgi:ABC-2 type transport system permease protein
MTTRPITQIKPLTSRQTWYRQVLVLFTHEVRVTMRDAAPLGAVAMIPLAMAFAKSTLGSALRENGFPHANGSEQVVPGLSVLMCFMMITFVGEAFFREHRWGTWERLRASSLRHWEIMVSKLLPVYLYFVGALVLLFAVGFVFLGLPRPRDPLSLVPLLLALPICLVTLGVALVSFSRSNMQLSALADVSGLALAGMGGALVPLETLPSWMRTVAVVTPPYWAMRGFRALFLEGAGWGAIVLPTLVLLGFSALFALVALRRFRFDDTRSTFR